ncbi:hypothetical protein SPBR_02014 [Sporothrix brasiliensis 5110]|uniref:Uncharacterized protein n=1 Tax=Sporothrix brasiliensis 5110 TaxID=1398154 RepID=A0A0C2EXT9_9PEZI|nr:uncharacterized protein SPBR_02014 [Sporothrix brasiliensis 5110]KIH91484.1 hypothetical protein SPBR_02014 [Sporothrix brasiliensis 5110]
MATARVRRAFRYTTDDDDAAHLDEPEVLDEEEQDTLIQSLVEQNQKRNEQFRQVLLAIPALAVVPFLIACFTSSSPSTAIVSMLGISSLGATAFLVHQQSPTKTGIRVLDAWSGADIKGKGRETSGAPLRLSDWSGAGGRPPPLEVYLPFLNLGLCAVLLLSLFVSRGAPSSTPYRLLGSLPAAVYGVVLVSKVTMAGVDPERELGRLRYEYKGA